MTDFQLGERVRAPARLSRRYGCINDVRTWEPTGGPIEGIYVGRRTYANGVGKGGYHPEDGPRYLDVTERVKVGLIVVDPRHNPVPVLYEDLERCD